MPTKTIDVLLSLEAEKAPSTKEIMTWMQSLEKEAAKLKKAIAEAIGKGANADKLKAELKGVQSQIKEVDALAKKEILAKSLKKAGEQANRTRERMEKLVQVGARVAMVGAAMIAPFALAVNKYLESQKAIEASGGKMDASAKKLVELSDRWAKSQERIGKVATEILLPYLVKALDLVDKIAAFAEENPGAVKAALGIGASMVLIGGALSTVGSIVSTLATIQGLFAGAGIVAGGTGAAGGTAAITTAIAGIAPAVGTAILAILSSPLTWAIAALALTVPIMNWLLGTNQTWSDIANTGHQALILIGYGIDKVIKGIGSYFTNLGQKLWDGLVKLSVSVVEGVGRAIESIISLFGGNKATGGYMPTGLYNVSEGGKREFALSHSTTRAAESMIGGQLTQQRLLSALGGGRRITYNDHSRYNTETSLSDRRKTSDFTMSRMTKALR